MVFKSSTGWAATAVTLLGLAFEADMTPFLTDIVKAVMSPEHAKVAVLIVTFVAALIAKRSHSTSTTPTP